jgi:hypothetical protein
LRPTTAHGCVSSQRTRTYAATPRWLSHPLPPRIGDVGRPPATFAPRAPPQARPYPLSVEAKPHLLSSTREAAIGTPPPPLLSSLFTSATAAPNTDALECPSNATEQEYRPQASLLPQAGRCEESLKPPHVVRRFRRGSHRWPPSPANARPRFHHHKVPTSALTLYGPQDDVGDPVSGLPPLFLFSRPALPWRAPPVSFGPPDLPQIGSPSHRGALAIVPPQASSLASQNWLGAAAQCHQPGSSTRDGLTPKWPTH